jgi:hypothetical protein
VKSAENEFELRDEIIEEWLEQHYPEAILLPQYREALIAAFHAGWEAREHVVHYALDHLKL